MIGQTFDPENIRQKDMDKLADAIEEYLTVLKEIMIIPEDMKKSSQEQIEEGIRRTHKLIKKLRKGDISVFKDSDEWDPLY